MGASTTSKSIEYRRERRRQGGTATTIRCNLQDIIWANETTTSRDVEGKAEGARNVLYITINNMKDKETRRRYYNKN